MKKFKWMALAACGGLVLQIGGCGALIGQILLQNIATTVLSGVLRGIIGGANAA